MYSAGHRLGDDPVDNLSTKSVDKRSSVDTSVDTVDKSQERRRAYQREWAAKRRGS